MFQLILAIASLTSVSALDNGMALTPPMGWVPWERFRCNIDCVNDPEFCISEVLMMQMADIMASEGYLDAGYNLLTLDDCWMDGERDADGKLQGDRIRFPSGIKALADYVHNKGLSFGIYEDIGTGTCTGYPGSKDNMELDTQTFANWTVDYVNIDGCYTNPNDMDESYPLFGFYLNKTGRPMTYSCSWPVYQIYNNIAPNWPLVVETCNMWRTYYGDVQDSWDAVSVVIDYFAENQDFIAKNAGPGHWNDPDSLVIGNFGLSYEQSKSQMAMWAMFAAPLLMSVDLRSMKEEYKEILLNKAVIAVNQDPLGIQGRRAYKADGVEHWVRPIQPVFENEYSYAVAFLNRRTDGTPYKVSANLTEYGLTNPSGYEVTDLFANSTFGLWDSTEFFSASVNPTGVVLLRFEALEARNNTEDYQDV